MWCQIDIMPDGAKQTALYIYGLRQTTFKVVLYRYHFRWCKTHYIINGVKHYFKQKTENISDGAKQTRFSWFKTENKLG